MPAGLVPDVGLHIVLQAWLSVTSFEAGQRQILLWVNDYTPDHTTLLSDLVEASFGGYGRKGVDESKWLDASDAPQCSKRQYDTAPLDWPVASGPTQTIFGWAMVNYVANRLAFVQRFDLADQWVIVPGNSFSLLPVISATQAACPGEGSMLRRSLL